MKIIHLVVASLLGLKIISLALPVPAIRYAPNHADELEHDVTPSVTSSKASLIVIPGTYPKENTILQEPPRDGVQPTAPPVHQKNLIIGSVIAVLLLAALLLGLILKYSRKRLAERRVRRFQRPRETHLGRNKLTDTLERENLKRTDSNLNCVIEAPTGENQPSGSATGDYKVQPAIKLNSAELDQTPSAIKPSLKRYKFLPHIIGYPDSDSVKPDYVNFQYKSRPVSVDFGAGFNLSKKAGNKTHAKRHSSHVVMETFSQSESTSHSRLTIIENLAYEDLITSQPVLCKDVGQQYQTSCVTKHVTAEMTIPRSVLRRKQEHQYETIVPSGTHTSSLLRHKTTLRPPSPIQIKRKSKSEDLTIFPVRSHRAAHQYETMIDPSENKNYSPASKAEDDTFALVNQPVPDSTIGREKDNSLALTNSKEGEKEKQRFWPPPTVKMKRKKIIVCEKEGERSIPKQIASSPVSERKKVENIYQEQKSRGTGCFPIKLKLETQQKSREKTGIDLIPKSQIILPTDTTAFGKIPVKKIRKPKPVKLSSKSKKTKGKIIKKVGNKSTAGHRALAPKVQPEVTKPRRNRTKRKVRKKRRSRDEIRRKLQLRLMGYSGAAGTGVGTGESYRADNNERASGFVAAARWKLSSEPVGFGSSDTSGEGEAGHARSGRRRIHSHEEWCRRWDNRRATESTLLEEIWRHLNVIAERSRLLKDSSSSRRRSQSLSSTTDNSVSHRRRWSQRIPEESDEEESPSNASSNSDEADDDVIGNDVMSTSDNGYCTYSHLPIRARPIEEVDLDENEDSMHTGQAASHENVIFSTISENTAGSHEKEPPNTDDGKGRVATLDFECKEEKIEPLSHNINICDSDVTVSSIHSCNNNMMAVKIFDANVTTTNIQAKSDPTDVIYEKLTDFCSLSSSMSSSCSSLVTSCQLKRTQVSRIPEKLQKKISQESKIIEDVLLEEDFVSKIKDEIIRVGNSFNNIGNGVKEEGTLKAPPNSPAFREKPKRENGTLTPLSGRNLSTVENTYFPHSKSARWQRRAISEGNYVVVSPSTLLRRKPCYVAKSYSLTENANSGIKLNSNSSSEIGARLKALSQNEGKFLEGVKIDPDVTIKSDDVSSKSGSDDVFITDKCEDSDESLFQVFMEMTM